MRDLYSIPNPPPHFPKSLFAHAPSDLGFRPYPIRPTTKGTRTHAPDAVTARQMQRLSAQQDLKYAPAATGSSGNSIPRSIHPATQSRIFPLSCVARQPRVVVSHVGPDVYSLSAAASGLLQAASQTRALGWSFCARNTQGSECRSCARFTALFLLRLNGQAGELADDNCDSQTKRYATTKAKQRITVSLHVREGEKASVSVVLFDPVQ